MDQLRVLHLASFEGNIGDNANHNGTHRLLRENLSATPEFTPLEIREFYYKQRAFDESFVELVNEYDLCLIGGGNYFELWVEHSCTGTSIDLSVELLQKIRTPLVFYALGVDAGQGVTEDRINRFKTFLDAAFEMKHMLVSIRNDGASATVMKYLGEQYLSQMTRIADGGFFLEVDDTGHPEMIDGKRHIVINLAGDMLETRFSPDSPGGIDYRRFLSDFSETLAEILLDNDDIHLVLVPHIFRDVQVFAELFEYFSDPLRRMRMTMAPYLHGKGSDRYIFDIYRKADLVLGTRFHANVCPIGLGTPTIGLVCYPQVALLYEELGLSERTVVVNQEGFGKPLKELIEDSLSDSERISDRYKKIRAELREELCSFQQRINELVSR